MASKKKTNANIDKVNDELTMLDKAAKSIFSIIDPSYTDKQVLSSKDQKIRSILDRELEVAKGVSQGSIVDFVSSLNTKNNQQKTTSKSNLSPNSNEIFTNNINDIFGHFQDMYRNRYLEIADLKFIAKFIPALGEAVKTVLDAIVASDNIAETINRKIELPASVSKEHRDEIINEIQRMEKDLKLLKKLKNNVYKKTIVTGTHYVYAVSYNTIYEEYDKIKKASKAAEKKAKHFQFGNPNQNTGSENKPAKEMMIGDVDISKAMESVRNVLSEAYTLDSNTKLNNSQIDSIINKSCEVLPTITCSSSMILEDALESVADIYDNEFIFNALESKSAGIFTKKDMFDEIPLSMGGIPDGTKGVNDKGSVKPSKFNIPGTYVKYIDCKNMIPVKIFDQKIGYYLVHPKAKKNKSSAGMTSGITTLGSTLFGSVNVAEERKHDAIQRITDSISEGILQNFDKKFVNKNSEYKKLIAECIVANGLTDQNYNIQFIPAEHVIEFLVNENDDGFGESILADSLFPAKLLLTMIVTRMLNYINKTGNKTIAHIYKGPVNAYTSNQINRVIRDLQEQNITFNDLLSPNLVFNKFNRDGNIALPTSKSGTRLVEFETQDGQNIDMSPEYEKELEKMAILGTGVPSVIMEYTDTVDFAKQIVSANIKFAGRISTLQAELEEATTDFYRILCKNSKMSDDCKTICEQSLEIKLPRPRVLANTNNGDYVRSIVETAEAIADLALGRESASNPEIMKNGAKIKEKIMYQYAKENSPFIDWVEIDAMVQRIIAEYSANKTEPKSSSTSSDSLGGADDMGSDFM